MVTIHTGIFAVGRVGKLDDKSILAFEPSKGRIWSVPGKCSDGNISLANSRPPVSRFKIFVYKSRFPLAKVPLHRHSLDPYSTIKKD